GVAALSQAAAARAATAKASARPTWGGRMLGCAPRLRHAPPRTEFPLPATAEAPLDDPEQVLATAGDALTARQSGLSSASHPSSCLAIVCSCRFEVPS